MKKYWENFSEFDVSVSLKGEIEYITDIMPKDRTIKILDVGGGLGNFEVNLEKKGYKNITMLDMCEKSVSIAKTRLGYTNLMIHDVLKGLPFKDNEFDIATCIEVLLHIDNPYFVLKELLRVSKTCIVSIINGVSSELSWNDCAISPHPLYFTPNWRTFRRGIECIGGKTISVKYFNHNYKLIRNIFPRLLCSSFIVTMEKVI